MNDLLLKFILAYLTDDNLRKLINPYKAEIFAKVEASAKASPEIWDDLGVKVLKVVFGVV